MKSVFFQQPARENPPEVRDGNDLREIAAGCSSKCVSDGRAGQYSGPFLGIAGYPFSAEFKKEFKTRLTNTRKSLGEPRRVKLMNDAEEFGRNRGVTCYQPVRR
jgi:hypothetical protein